MSRYRKRLPQLGNSLFLTDGGLEHALTFDDGVEVPGFITFDLLRHGPGRALLRRYFADYAEIACVHGVGAVLESPTVRANTDWGANLGYDARALAQANRKAIGLLLEIREAFESDGTQIVISGNVGPRANTYHQSSRMAAYQAAQYHAPQVRTLSQTAADMISASGMTYADEAVGIALVAAAYAMPVAISFRLRGDGRLPSGETLAEAIGRVDCEAPHTRAYYMIECAEPAQFAAVIGSGRGWPERIRGLRLVARSRSDIADATRLGMQFRTLRAERPHLALVGTSPDGVEAMCRAMSEQPMPDVELLSRLAGQMPERASAESIHTSLFATDDVVV